MLSIMHCVYLHERKASHHGHLTPSVEHVLVDWIDKNPSEHAEKDDKSLLNQVPYERGMIDYIKLALEAQTGMKTGPATSTTAAAARRKQNNTTQNMFVIV